MYSLQPGPVNACRSGAKTPIDAIAFCRSAPTPRLLRPAIAAVSLVKPIRSSPRCFGRWATWARDDFADGAYCSRLRRPTRPRRSRWAVQMKAQNGRSWRSARNPGAGVHLSPKGDSERTASRGSRPGRSPRTTSSLSSPAASPRSTRVACPRAAGRGRGRWRRRSESRRRAGRC